MSAKFINLKDDQVKEIIEKRKNDGMAEITLLNIVKKRTMLFMLIIIFVGLFVPFVAQWIPSELLPWEIHADIWNSYVSIILGIVATFCSLLSIYLAFYAQNQTIKSNNDTIDDFNGIRQEINNSIQYLNRLENKMDRLHDDIQQIDRQPTTTVTPIDGKTATTNSEKELFENGDKIESATGTINVIKK